MSASRDYLLEASGYRPDLFKTSAAQARPDPKAPPDDGGAAIPLNRTAWRLSCQHLTVNGASPSEAAPVHLSRPAPGIIAALFCGYLCVGLPLPVIPLFIHDKLGFSNLVVGLVIGIQFLATVLTRGYAGRLTDHHGGKRSALQGAAVCALGGLLYLVAAMPGLSPGAEPRHRCRGPSGGRLRREPVRHRLRLLVDRLGRPATRGHVDVLDRHRDVRGTRHRRADRHGALSGLRPAGRHDRLHRRAARRRRSSLSGRSPYVTPAGQRLPFYRVIGQIWREGLGLMLQGVGLSGLTAFASLYFAARNWGHAGLVMTAFGIGFIFVRVALGHLPDKMSGYRVALWSLVIEAIGQAMLWGAPYEIVALAGALVTGLGCALVFPALGVEALKRVLPANRGSAMGAFVAFLDIAYGISGPAAGIIAGQFGYAAVYLFGAACALLGAALVVTARSPQS